MGIFKSDGSSSGCPALPQPLTEHGSAYQIMFYITIAGIALTAIFSLSLIFMHLTRYIAPKEQRQIVRLVFAPVVIAFMSIISLISYTAARYVAELGDLYDAFALAGLYLLFVQFSIPSGTSGPELFDNMDQNSGSSKNPRKADWPQVSIPLSGTSHLQPLTCWPTENLGHGVPISCRHAHPVHRRGGLAWGRRLLFQHHVAKACQLLGDRHQDHISFSRNFKRAQVLQEHERIDTEVTTCSENGLLQACART